MQEDRRGDGVVWALDRCLKDGSGGGEGGLHAWGEMPVCDSGHICTCVSCWKGSVYQACPRDRVRGGDGV